MGGTSIDYNKLNDKNWLKLQYINNKRSTIDISIECKCSPALVSKKLKEHGIKSRTTSESMKLISVELSERGKANWENLEYREKTSEAISDVIQSNPDIKQKMISGSRDYWATPESREEVRKRWEDGLYDNRPAPTMEARRKLSVITASHWRDPGYRSRVTKKISDSVITAIEEGRIQMTNSSICGYYNSSKIGQIYLKSKWEFEIAVALDTSKFKWEYEFERVPYVLDGYDHIYLPDFRIDGCIVLETKRSDWRKDGRERAKIEAGRKVFGEKYILVDSKAKLNHTLKLIKDNRWPS